MPPFGAQTIGVANYAIPSGAYYVAASGGNDSNSAAQAQNPATPWATLQHAVNSVSAGATIVVRGGSYRQSTFCSVPVTIQNYPNEAVWFTGSDVVTAWSLYSGSVYVYNGYTQNFDPTTTSESPMIDPNFPMAGYPDMVFVNGVQYTQVASLAAVNGANKFYADQTNNKLYIWGNPAGKTVEAASRTYGLQIANSTGAAGCDIRGIGFEHYATNTNQVAAVVTQAAQTTFENCVFNDNAAVGLTIEGSDCRIFHCTANGNGQEGMSSLHADNALIEGNWISGNNVEHFDPGQFAGGIKLHSSRGEVVSNNWVDGNLGTGLWIDCSVIGMTIAHNRVTNNTLHGIQYEISAFGTIVDNYVSANGGRGIYIPESNNLEIWNNTSTKNADHDVYILDGNRDLDHPETYSAAALDSRYTVAQLKAAGLIWDTLNINVFNNVLSEGAPYMIGLDDTFSMTWRTRRSGWDMNDAFDYNGYYRVNASSPTNLAHWRKGPNSGDQIVSTSLSAFKSATAAAAPSGKMGEEIHGVAQDGGTPFIINEAGGLYNVRSASIAKGVGAPLSSSNAAAMGVMSGSAVDLGVLPIITEGESATIQSVSGPMPILNPDSGLSGGYGSKFLATTPNSDKVYYSFAVPEARTYDVRVRYKKLNDRGTYQIALWNGSVYVNMGSPVDMYSSTAAYVEADLGNFTITSTDYHYIKFSLTGKNASSSGYALFFDYIKLIPR